MEQFELFKCLHQRLNLRWAIIGILFDTLTGRFSRNSLFIRVWHCGFPKVDGLDHIFELGAVE